MTGIHAQNFSIKPLTVKFLNNDIGKLILSGQHFLNLFICQTILLPSVYHVSSCSYTLNCFFEDESS